MPKGRVKAKSGVVAWWLSSGEEECPHCGCLYVYEVEFRCPDCDGPSCPQCKTTYVDNRIVCPGCVGGGKSG